MTPESGKRILRVVLLLLPVTAAFAVTGCVDEKVVFQERPLFEQPASQANGFLGYSQQDAKLTVCGNCHVGTQNSWEETGHAAAWEGLQQSGSVQDFCRNCHTVNELGNSTEAEGGFVATESQRYHDVQCEACHGPGQTHVENPDGSQPLASIQAGVDLETGCGECHSGAHHPFTNQWAQSAHGIASVKDRPYVSGACLDCHEGEAAMRNTFGETANFVGRDDDQRSAITCAVCHDPHGSENAAQLRAPVDVASEQHLCVQCHSQRGTPGLTQPNLHGPHGYQGNLVLGEDIGWVPPNADLSGTFASTHGTEGNPELCATCHVAQRTITDDEGNFQVEAVGHTFEATPCLDDQGLPREDCTIQEQNFEACATSGCHGNAETARNLFVTSKNGINDLLDQLWADSDGDNNLETSDGGLLPQVLAAQGEGEINPADSTFTTAEGALWNAQVAHTEDRLYWGDFTVGSNPTHFGAHKGSGDGVHNPFLLEALLRASIDAVENEYGLTASATVERFTTPPPGVTVTSSSE